MPKIKAFLVFVALILCVLLGAILCGLYLAFDLTKQALLWLPTRAYNALTARLFPR